MILAIILVLLACVMFGSALENLTAESDDNMRPWWIIAAVAWAIIGIINAYTVLTGVWS